MSRLTLTRRELLAAAAALGASSAAGWRPARAGNGAPVRRFILVFAMGGWDLTRLWARDTFGSPGVAFEPAATLATVGGHEIVDHPDRPQVRGFFQDWGGRAAIVDGMVVRSVNHRICQRLVLSNDPSGRTADWPSVIAAAERDRFPLPSTILSGFSVPGPLARYATYGGRKGQLSEVQGNAIMDLPDQTTTPTSDALRELVVQASGERARERMGVGTEADRAAAEALSDALDRTITFRERAEGLVLGIRDLHDQMRNAASLLELDISRVVTVGLPGFDTHSGNEAQTGLYEQVFGALDTLLTELSTRSGTSGTLLDETTVVITSEMGRTPYAKPNGGKDHWPYTSAMLLGAGIQGGVRLGAYNDVLEGLDLDAQYRPSTSGEPITPAQLGATMLQLAGLRPEDPADVLSPLLT